MKAFQVGIAFLLIVNKAVDLKRRIVGVQELVAKPSEDVFQDNQKNEVFLTFSRVADNLKPLTAKTGQNCFVDEKQKDESKDVNKETDEVSNKGSKVVKLVKVLTNRDKTTVNLAIVYFVMKDYAKDKLKDNFKVVG